MKKLAIFDFDGTLVDTITDVGHCFNKTLEYFGFKPFPLEQYGKVVGGNLEVIFSKLLDENDRTEENILKLKEKYREVYSLDEKPNTKPFEGVIGVLEKLTSHGVLIAINTNKAQVLTEQLCEKLFKKINFVDVIGYCDDRPCKPDPCAVNKLMSANNVDASGTVYIGDGLTDIKTAENAGIDCVLVSWGQGDVETLKKEAAVSFVANSPGDILRYMEI